METFSCAKCRKPKYRWYHRNGSVTLEAEVRAGRFKDRLSRKKVCRYCKDEEEEEFLDDIIGGGLFHSFPN
jgi:hypothetical protein